MNSEVTMEKKGFHSRGLTSLISLMSFLIMTVTGLVLYFVPEGRVAYWVNWKLLGLTKTDWGNIHIISSIVFAIAAGFHLYLNWKPLMNYLAGKIERTLKFRKELVVTSIVTVLIVAGSISLIPPFNYVIDFSKYLKGTWVTNRDYEPPFGHAEEVSLKILARKMDIDLEKAVAELRAQGFRFDSEDEKLKDIAMANDMTPMEVYVVINEFVPDYAGETTLFTPELVEEKFAGTGIGNKELSWLLDEIGIDKTLARERLLRNNIAIADDETLKKTGERYSTEPIEILKIMLVDDYSIRR
jgi:hypothetical protein